MISVDGDVSPFSTAPTWCGRSAAPTACVAVAAADAVCTARSDGARPAPIASIRVRTSPNIYKNGMSVGIPGYAGVGLDAAAALGALIAALEAGLAIFEGVTPAIAAAAEDLCARGAVEVAIDEGAKGVYACVEVETGGATGRSVVSGGHTNVVERFRNGERVWEELRRKRPRPKTRCSIG